MAPDWKSQYHIFYDDPTHIHPYTAASMKGLLNMCGFRDVAAERFTQLPKMWEDGHPLYKAASLCLRGLGSVKKFIKINLSGFPGN